MHSSEVLYDVSLGFIVWQKRDAMTATTTTTTRTIQWILCTGTQGHICLEFVALDQMCLVVLVTHFFLLLFSVREQASERMIVTKVSNIKGKQSNYFVYHPAYSHIFFLTFHRRHIITLPFPCSMPFSIECWEANNSRAQTIVTKWERKRKREIEWNINSTTHLENECQYTSRCNVRASDSIEQLIANRNTYNK